MSRVCSEDSVRLAFKKVDPEACARWQQKALARTWEPALKHRWILDMDMTVKPIYGHQEGAEIGYNPHKPGRPSHALHTWFVRGMRLVLDVEVRPGKEHAAKAGQSRLWALWDSLTPECRPWLACGDAGFGQEGMMVACEGRGQNYLFRQRQTLRVQQLIQRLMGTTTTRWTKTSRGWEAAEGQLRLQGWSRSRRMGVLRRLRERANPSLEGLPESTAPTLPWTEVVKSLPEYEHLVLVTNLTLDLAGLTDLYLQRADAENVYDELKNQWGWGGFMTQDLHRCQVAARNVGLVYNGWSLFVLCVAPERIGPSTQGADHQPARRRQGRSGAFERVEPVPEWTSQYCGAVESQSVLATNLGPHFGSAALPKGTPGRTQWMIQVLDQKRCTR